MRLALVASIVLGIAVGMYGAVSSHAVVSSVFLGICAFALVLVVGLLLRTARAAVEEPPPIAEEQVTGRRKKELEREKLLLLKALKELEFDHEMRKVSDADFREIGGQYRARAMRVLRQLDAEGADYKTLVEKELKARLGATQQSAAADKPAAPVDDHACASCGTVNDEDAVFCKKCGKKVAA